MITDHPALQAWACHPKDSRGRLYPEPESTSRTPFQRDRDRIIHSGAFRRLQYKTQVFVVHEGDFFRTRLTHSLEVAQIARAVARRMGLNEDLAETLALAHDLGHPPFGHAGETALDQEMAAFGGFDHNAQTIRVLTQLEERYPAFQGLNLTWESLEGIAKHNGPMTGSLSDGSYAEGLPWAMRAYLDQHDLEIGTFASAEAQLAALADDIAYNNHDLDDGLRAGLFSFGEILDLPVVGPLVHAIRQEFPDLPEARLIQELIRRQIGVMVDDLLAESVRRIDDMKPGSVTDIRHGSHAVIAFSDAMQHDLKELKSWLFANMYRHYKVNRQTSKAKRIVRDLFRLYTGEPNILPTEWQARVDGPNTETTARAVCDFIAGMTDRYAMEEHQKLFDLYGRA